MPQQEYKHIQKKTQDKTVYKISDTFFHQESHDSTIVPKSSRLGAKPLRAFTCVVWFNKSDRLTAY